MTSDFALRFNDGDVCPEQVAYVDGYTFGDTLLEGVRFKVEVKTNAEGLSELICEGVHPDAEAYMKKFVKAQIDQWCENAVDHLARYYGDAADENGDEVHWGDS